MRTSFGQLRDFNAQAAAGKIDVAKSYAPLAAPQAAPPPAPNTALDVWSSFALQGLESDADQTRRAGVGADYKIGKATIVGVVAERGEINAAGGVEDDQKLAAYIAVRAAPLVTIDARTEWQATEAPLGAGASEKRSVSVAPRIAQSVALGDGKTLEPFVTYKHAFDLGSSGADAAAAVSTQSAGAGLTYVKRDAYSLSVTTDLENVGSGAASDVNSKLQFKMPIR